ncbi:EF-hand domain-containing family member C2-like [Chanos chanos]|uniref:EF-hand domain-containing family member C2 n=1 Tax=Chanos chanos TaxID=29144 RepID=A0A6J2WCB7_CHACN|nr:EF-hand domain-containing family member C2-like [Chanos chanos]
MALPLLPGSSLTRNLGKEKFNKSHHFEYANGVPMVVGEDKADIDGQHRAKNPMFPKGEGSNAPSWLTFDKQVLCFHAYFQEDEPQMSEKEHRIRKCKIYFYLEDNTIQVMEPEVKNSGILQGTLIKRQRIPMPFPDDDQFYSVHHFNINHEMVLYSRTFMITDCDHFTRKFLENLGVRLNPPAVTPMDPYTNQRKEMELSMKPLRPYERQHTLRQFLDHDRKVLRFYCYWDDTENMFGDPRELILLYFLADDTIEIREVIYPNSGRDAASKFLNRSKLPKHAPISVHQPGEITNRPLLNVFGRMGRGERYVLDRQTGALKEEFYKDSDLIIGGVINVWGRRVVICDCDEFTKEYYHSTYGIEDFGPVQYKSTLSNKIARQVPPYTGFGSEEDSLGSCLGLMPKRPQKDFRKVLEKDRQGMVSNVLRFVGKLVTDNPNDKRRDFIISFYLCDDTISVFELPKKNSGTVLGGKFLERNRVKKPGQELFKSEMSEYIKPQDLYVGARLILNDHPFQLVDADEFTFSYMEQHAEQFPRANIRTIINKIKSFNEEKQKEMEQFLTRSDPGNTGYIQYEPFRIFLAGMDCQLSQHEIVTLCRAYSVWEQPEVEVSYMLAVAQDQLRKKQFESFSEMLRAFIHEDRTRSGLLSIKETIVICRAFKMPLVDDLLRALLQRFEKESENIDYNAFLSGINWRENPASPVVPNDAFKFGLNLNGETVHPAVKNINYSILLEDVFGKATDTNDS